MTWLLRTFIVMLLLAVTPAARADDTVVTLDAIKIKGGEGLSRERLEAAIDLNGGESMPRARLDERVETARQRLEAMRLYATVDMRLEKGGLRHHYVLIVNLGRAVTWYGGLALSANKDQESGDDAHGAYDNETLYFGSRALAGTDLRAEVSAKLGNMRWDVKDGDFEDSDLSTEGVLFDPSLCDTPWFAGLNAEYGSAHGVGHYNVRNEAGERTGVDRTKYVSYQKSFGLTAGRRFGLLSAAVTARRSFNRSDSESSLFSKGSYEGSSKQITADLRYSEKPGIVRLEPGLVSTLSYDRAYYEKRISAPVTSLTLLNTWIFGNQAVTPAGAYVWRYGQTCDYSVFICKSVTFRTYDLSLTYERAFLERFVGGLTFGAYQVVDANGYIGGHRLVRRWKATLGTTIEQFQVDLSFIYGRAGLDKADEKAYGFAKQGQSQ